MKCKTLLLLLLLSLNACRYDTWDRAPETGKLLPVYRAFLAAATDTTLPDSARQVAKILERTGMTEAELDSMLNSSAKDPKGVLKAISEIISELEHQERQSPQHAKNPPRP